MKKKIKALWSIVIGAILIVTALPTTMANAASGGGTLTFSDAAITETVSGSGYTIDGTVLTVNSAGTFRINGSCSDGCIEVAKGLSGVTLILDNLELASSSTAPIVVKKGSTVTITVVGTSTLTDNEDAAAEDTNADFEGAAIKVKSGSSLTLAGDGTLTVLGNAKNGIKGGAESDLTVTGGVYTVTSANNGIAFDGSVTIYGGTFDIASANDGIKSVPDEGDTASAGTVTIYGGTFKINAQGDGIQAANSLSIADGSFSVKTLDGYKSSGFDSDTMSCKGLKASGNETTETEGSTAIITVTGGTFDLNTADDGVHSDGDIVITGGTFDIYTGDDGVHSDTSLTLGSEGGFERDPEITVHASYEGLESGTIYSYSGKYNITASDDGVNSAGGSSSGSDSGGGGGNHFNPGGRPGGGWSGGTQPSSGNYAIYIYGGDFYVNCTGDGLDANGSLYLYGGNICVLSQGTGGDNSPLDTDGSVIVKGTTLFAAGTNPMNEGPSSSTSQKFYTSTSRYSAGTVVNVKYNNSLVYSEKLPRTTNYIIYSSPDMTSTSCSLSTASNVTSCVGDAWNHTWNSGTVTESATATESGTITYTCTSCGKTERKTIPATTTIPAEDGCPSAGYTDVVQSAWYHEAVDYAIENGLMTGTSATTFEPSTELSRAMIVTVLYSLEGKPETAYADIFDDIAEGEWYSIPVIWASENGIVAGYGNGLFGANDKITREQAVTILMSYAKYKSYETTLRADLTAFSDHADISDWALEAVEWANASGLISGRSATSIAPKASMTRAETAQVIMKFITGIMETADSGEETFTATFVTDGHSSIDVYYTQDYTEPSETDVTCAYARNSDTGETDVSGDGQINFKVTADEGYEVSEITVDGSYKNLKEIGDGFWRITKIAGDITVTVTTASTSG